MIHQFKLKQQTRLPGITYEETSARTSLLSTIRLQTVIESTQTFCKKISFASPNSELSLILVNIQQVRQLLVALFWSRSIFGASQTFCI